MYTSIRKSGPAGHIGHPAIWVAMNFDKCMSTQPTSQYVASILPQGVAFTMTYNRFAPSGTKKSWLILRYIRNNRKHSSETFVICHIQNIDGMHFVADENRVICYCIVCVITWISSTYESIPSWLAHCFYTIVYHISVTFSSFMLIIIELLQSEKILNKFIKLVL